MKYIPLVSSFVAFACVGFLLTSLSKTQGALQQCTNTLELERELFEEEPQTIVRPAPINAGYTWSNEE